MKNQNNVIFAENKEMAVSEEILKRRAKVAEILQKKRVQISMTQEELAEKSGFSRSTIIRIEQCQFSPNADQLYVLLDVLGISIRLDDEYI